jgi:transposase
MPKNIYSDEFKRDVVAVALRGDTTQMQIATDFGISKSALTAWLRQHAAGTLGADSPAAVAKSAAEKDVQRELAAAKKRIVLLEQEAEIMRRAVGYLSRGVNPK